MTMLELFQHRLFSLWLTTVGCFPVNRNSKDSQAVRTALHRLKQGHIVGIFPEGGIRLGSESVLGGASLPKSVASIAQMADCPIRTCLILGSDQLYDWKNLWRRPEVYLVFGEEYRIDSSISKSEARQKLTDCIEQSFRAMYKKLEEEGKVTPELYPRTAQERWEFSSSTSNKKTSSFV